MAKIERLTPSQEDDLVALRNEWLAIGRSTEPIDRPRAIAVITRMYRAIGEDEPAVLWFTSPAICLLAYGTLRALAEGRGQLGSQLGSQLESQLGSQLWSQLESQLRSQLKSQLRSQLESQLWSKLGPQLGPQLKNYFGGAHWCHWEVFYDYCNRIGVRYTESERSGLDLWQEQSRACHWWWPYKGLVIASERSSRLQIDEQGRLHSSDGLAMGYSDGWGIYAWHGTRVPEETITTHSDAIDITKALQESNAEIRRVWLERAGWERVLSRSSAIPIHADETGSLYRIDTADEDEPLMLVRVINSTPEAGERLGLILHNDGTWRKPYVLLVHPELRPLGPDGPIGEPQELTAHNAVASSFGLRGEQYRPGCQS